MVFREQSLQQTVSHLRHADGVRVENVPRIHDVGHPRRDSEIYGRCSVWTWAVQRKTSSSCQCATTLNGEQKETQKDVNTIHRQLRIMLADSLAVIGLYWGLDQKKSGTELTLTDLTDHGINLQRIWWQISQDPVIQYFVPPVHLRGELRSKEESKKSMHFNGSDENIELLLRTVISANQPSFYGATADLCNVAPKDFRAPWGVAISTSKWTANEWASLWPRRSDFSWETKMIHFRLCLLLSCVGTEVLSWSLSENACVFQTKESS